MSRHPWLALVALLFGCGELQNDPADYVYQCETSQEAAFDYSGGQVECGKDDPNLPPEPSLPTDICRTLIANKAFPDEDHLDTERVQDALNECKGRAVRLVADGENNAFITAHIEVDSNFELFGSMVASSIDLDSNCKIHFDESLAEAREDGIVDWIRVAYRALPYRP